MRREQQTESGRRQERAARPFPCSRSTGNRLPPTTPPPASPTRARLLRGKHQGSAGDPFERPPDADRPAGAYHRAMSPLVLGLALLLGLVVLLPARRLYLAGWSSAAIATYYVAVWILAFVIAWFPGRSRFLVPLLLVAYLVPFITFRLGVDRLARRLGVRPPPRNVTPPERGGPIDPGA